MKPINCRLHTNALELSHIVFPKLPSPCFESLPTEIVRDVQSIDCHHRFNTDPSSSFRHRMSLAVALVRVQNP